MSNVEHPDHYNEVPNWEVIDTIRKDLSSDEYIGFLKGNILKYRLRAGYKGDVLEDIEKANYYKDLLLKFLKEQEAGKDKALKDLLNPKPTPWPYEPYGPTKFAPPWEGPYKEPSNPIIDPLIWCKQTSEQDPTDV